ncbi:vacuolar iron transporter homolog 4 isoform X1 [Arachis hypogaea]|uniref:vacuolar iron transporter homolog 4 isoform X1 n=2 Tax=Arachis hypogaea TaxID=3818 RepID=UPI000DECFFDD|nr:vacuolar iron transporter homolog 4 isoform X1 [Arachis hypogaea]
MASNAACVNNLVAGEVVVAAKMSEEDGNNNVDYSQRGQWLRAAVLGANDGLVSVASLMMGVGAVKRDSKAMLLAGLVGCIAGACSMALGEYVSVSTQYEVEVAQIKRDMMMMMENKNEMEKKRRSLLPNPLHAALASALSFTVGAVIPLVFTAFVRDYRLRLGLCVVVSSLFLVGFGCLGAELGHTHNVKSSIRILIGGLLAMAITFGLTKLVGFSANLEL